MIPIFLLAFFALAAAQNPCMKKATGSGVCTAGDVRLSSYTLLDVNLPTCVLGNTLTVTLRANIVPGSDTRYDIGFWINTQGNSALTDTADNCYRDYLHPVVTGGQTCNNNGGPYPNLNAGPNNVCGDLTLSCGSNVTLSPIVVTIKCTDSDNNGVADLSSCTSWSQSSNPTCKGALDTNPGAPSKCDCGVVPIVGLRTCPKVTLAPAGPLCVNDSAVTLVGLPAPGPGESGIYAVNGANLASSSFNPATFGVGVYTVTYTFNDNAGCSASANITITVNPIPTLSAPADITIQCGDSTDISNTGNATASHFTSISYTDTTVAGCVPGIRRTWTVSNNCGTVTASQLITVQDNTPPVIATLPAPITITCPDTPDSFSINYVFI